MPRVEVGAARPFRTRLSDCAGRLPSAGQGARSLNHPRPRRARVSLRASSIAAASSASTPIGSVVDLPGSSRRPASQWMPAAADAATCRFEMLEVECGRTREEKNALVDEDRLRRRRVLRVPAGLEHVRDGSELVGRSRWPGSMCSPSKSSQCRQDACRDYRQDGTRTAVHAGDAQTLRYLR